MKKIILFIEIVALISILILMKCNLEYPPIKLTPPLGLHCEVNETRNVITIKYFATHSDQETSLVEGYNVYYFKKDRNPKEDGGCENTYSNYDTDTTKNFFNAAVTMCWANKNHIKNDNEVDIEDRTINEEKDIIQYLVASPDWLKNSKADYAPTTRTLSSGNIATEKTHTISPFNLRTKGENNELDDLVIQIEDINNKLTNKKDAQGNDLTEAKINELTETKDELTKKKEAYDIFEYNAYYYFAMSSYSKTNRIESDLSNVTEIFIPEPVQEEENPEENTTE